MFSAKIFSAKMFSFSLPVGMLQLVADFCLKYFSTRELSHTIRVECISFWFGSTQNLPIVQGFLIVLENCIFDDYLKSCAQNFL